MIEVNEHKPVRCKDCNADEMGCAVKRGLSGRACCDACSHRTCRPHDNQPQTVSRSNSADVR